MERIEKLTESKLNQEIARFVTLNGFSKDSLHQLYKEFFAALKAYEGTGLTPAEITAQQGEIERLRAERDDFRKILEDISDPCGACKHVAKTTDMIPCSTCCSDNGSFPGYEYRGLPGKGEA